jgi:hypothetical protein
MRVCGGSLQIIPLRKLLVGVNLEQVDAMGTNLDQAPDDVKFMIYGIYTLIP